MRYSEDVIEQVRNANDIVDVIGQYVKLTKKGANYFGLCPFHGEKTPSFSVSPQKQIYYCFGCGAGGNVITFLMEYENETFVEALKELAERAHIALPAPNESGEGRADAERKARLFAVNKTAALWYYDRLHREEGQAGYAYFREKRRLSDRTITHFGLGYAGKTPDALYQYLRGKGFDDLSLKQSGLCTIEERGPRDKFWNRVMFPIMDVNNRVIAFGGRVMGDGMPKYLNSPETPIFDKSGTLYGLNFARRSRRKFLLLCEGYMDVIALHQAGFTNAVASLGTAFNEKHARLLKRYTDDVILTQDSDEAGVRAKLRAFPILRDAGLNVKVLTIEGYKDPDELIRAEGPDAYEAFIQKAKNAFLFEIDAVKAQYDFADPAEKTKFYEDTAERLCMFTEPLEQDNYIQAVSHEHMIPYEELKRLVARKMLRIGTKPQTEKRYDPDQAYLKQEAEEAHRREEAQQRNRAAQDASQSGFAGDESEQAFDSYDAYEAALSAFASDEAGAVNEADAADKAHGAEKSGAEQTGAEPSGREENGQKAAGQKADGRQSQRGGMSSAQGERRAASLPGHGQANRTAPRTPLRLSRKEAAVLKSERLLLSWFSVRPDIIEPVFAHLSLTDFSDGIYREIAEEILKQEKAGGIKPAAIMDLYAGDEEKRRQAGAIFNADATHRAIDDMSEQDFEKALTEAVRNIRQRRLDEAILEVGGDVLKFQALMQEKTALSKMWIHL